MIQGIWLPIITPFKNDRIDYISYKKLIDHYISEGISGIIPLGTTGESPTISDYEYEELIDYTMQFVKERVPVYVGLGSNYTAKLIKQLHIVEKHKVDGILSVTPYYNRPSQRGIYEHFKSIADATDLNILLYNIPYRTGRNMENDTVYKLAECSNIVGLKDASGDIKQTMELLANPPIDFSIMTGEDLFFYQTLALGGNGGIMASAHLRTREFIRIYEAMNNNDYQLALKHWHELYELIPPLFEEPNPAPIKYVLHKLGLIDSAECRLPLTRISNELAMKLNRMLWTMKVYASA